MSEKQNKGRFTKIVYFDEQAAQDYLDITNGGRLDWSKEENKKRVAEILAEIEAQAKGGFNILEWFKLMLSGEVNAKATGALSSIFDTTIKNTLLTDYIEKASTDRSVCKFTDCVLYAPENSVSMYKMISSYLTVVPKDQLPIDMEKLNDAVLGERGYYSMLIDGKDDVVLRFNIKAFFNNYSLADIGKMKLGCFGVEVGKCQRRQLSIDQEFIQPDDKKVPTAEDIVDGLNNETDENILSIYDVVLAGVFV